MGKSNEFAAFNTDDERRFQAWLRSMGIDASMWCDNREWTKEELEELEGDSAGVTLRRES